MKDKWRHALMVALYPQVALTILALFVIATYLFITGGV